MNKTKNRWSGVGKAAFSVLTLFALMAVALSGIVYAQRISQKQSADNPVVYEEKFGTAAVSESKVKLRLTFDDGTVWTVTQFEGAMIKVKRNGITIGISPHVDKDRWNQISTKVFRLAPVSVQGVTQGKIFKEVGSFDVGPELSEFLNRDLGVRIEVVDVAYDVRSLNKNDLSSRMRVLDGGGRSECCVTCSGTTLCGCSVEAPCGGCCVGSCCGLFG